MTISAEHRGRDGRRPRHGRAGTGRRTARNTGPAQFGAAPAGVPAGGGYAVGNRLVDAYLAATGRSAAEALHVPSREIIEVALGELSAR